MAAWKSQEARDLLKALGLDGRPLHVPADVHRLAQHIAGLQARLDALESKSRKAKS